MNPLGNPNHDPKTGQFSSGPDGAGSHVNGGAHSEHRSLGTRVLHGAKIAAQTVALGALAVGAIALAHGASRRSDQKFERKIREDYSKNLGEADAKRAAHAASRRALEDKQLRRTKAEFVKPVRMPRAARLHVKK